MSDTTELLLVLLAVYLIECVVSLRPDGLALLAWWPGRHRATSPLSLRGSRTLALVLAPPWPPLSPPVVAEPWPFDVDPDGVGHGDRQIGWAEVVSLDVDGRVVIVKSARSGVVGSAGSEVEAAAFERLLAQVIAVSPGDRSAVLLRAIADRFDLGAVRARLAELSRRALLVRAGASVLLLTIAVGAPVAIYGEQLVSGWAVLAVGLVAWGVTAAVTLRASRRLGLSVSQRIGLCLSPLSAIRAGDHFQRHATRGLEPVAAALLVSSPDARAVARHALSDWTLRASSAGRWLPTRLAEAAHRCLAAEGLDAAALFEPPAPDGATSVAFCPRCLSQFVAAPVCCPSCGDVPTRPIPRPPSA